MQDNGLGVKQAAGMRGWAFTCRIAGTGGMALIQGRADEGIAARARASMAGVRLGADVVVIAGRAIRLWQDKEAVLVMRCQH